MRMNKKRKKIVIAFSLVTLLVIGSLSVYVFTRKKETEKPVIQPSSETEKVSSSSTASSLEASSELSEDDKNHRKVLNSLEKPNEPADENIRSEVAEAMEAAQKYVNENKDINKLKGDYDNRLLMTDGPMVQTFWIAITVNKYSVEPTQVEAYKSKNGDVVQFICKLKADGKNSCYFVGNYNIYAKQLQLVSYHGGEVGASFG